MTLWRLSLFSSKCLQNENFFFFLSGRSLKFSFRLSQCTMRIFFSFAFVLEDWKNAFANSSIKNALNHHSSRYVIQSERVKTDNRRNFKPNALLWNDFKDWLTALSATPHPPPLKKTDYVANEEVVSIRVDLIFLLAIRHRNMRPVVIPWATLK